MTTRNIYELTTPEAIDYFTKAYGQLATREDMSPVWVSDDYGGGYFEDPTPFLSPKLGDYQGGLSRTGSGYEARLTPAYDPHYGETKDVGGMYGYWVGEYDDTGKMTNLRQEKAQRSGGWLDEHFEEAALLAFAALAGPAVLAEFGLGAGAGAGAGAGGISPGVMAGLETGLAGGAGAGGISAGTMAGLEAGLPSFIEGGVGTEALLGGTAADTLATGAGISEGTMAGLEAGLPALEGGASAGVGAGISEGTMAGLEAGLAEADTVGKTLFDKATAAYKAASPFISAAKMAKSLFGGSSGSSSGSGAGGLGGMGGVLGLALLLGQLNRDRNAQPAGATPVVPLRRSKVTQRPFTMGKPPLGYFGERVYYADGGGVMGLARGGSSESRAIRGPGDGTSDSIPARINGHEPAALADGEFVIDARTVAELGNGSTEAGVEKLEAMIKRVHAVRAKAKRGEDSNADEHLPA